MVAACAANEAVVVVEEHSIYGGLGSAIAEIVAEHCPRHVLRIGVQDRFSACAGTYQYLLEEHQLTAAHVARQVTEKLVAIDVHAASVIPARHSTTRHARSQRTPLEAIESGFQVATGNRSHSKGASSASTAIPAYSR